MVRIRILLIAALAAVGFLIVAPGSWAQVSNAGKAPETPAPQVVRAWRGVGPVAPCVLPWGGIYACPPAPATVAIRAGRMFDSIKGAMLTKQVVLIQGQRITEVGPEGSVTIPAGTRVIDLSQAGVILRTQVDVVIGEWVDVDPSATGQVDAETGHHEVVERGAAMIPDTELLDRRSPGDEVFPFRPDSVGGIDVLLTNVDAVDEAGFGDEARAVVEIEALQVELASSALQIDFVAGSCRVAAIDI